jgi:hypothetical protein
MLCIEKYKIFYSFRYIKTNLFCTYTLYHKLWHNHLGWLFRCNKVFILQKKSIRIIMNSRSKESCRDLFKNSKIMTFLSQYIFSLVLFTINNDHLFNSNNKIHSYKTRAHCNLHLPAVNLTKYSKGAYISGIDAFNHLPQSIKRLATNEASFKRALKRFLYQHSFCSMQDNHNCTKFFYLILLFMLVDCFYWF